MFPVWLDELPQDCRDIVSSLLTSDWPGVDRLKREVEAHRIELEDRHRTDEMIDLRLARALGAACMALLDRLPADASAADQQAVLAAVRYFVLDDDASADSESCLGLDDDAQVFNVVARHLGHSDLEVEVS